MTGCATLNLIMLLVLHSGAEAGQPAATDFRLVSSSPGPVAGESLMRVTRDGEKLVVDLKVKGQLQVFSDEKGQGVMPIGPEKKDLSLPTGCTTVTLQGSVGETDQKTNFVITLQCKYVGPARAPIEIQLTPRGTLLVTSAPDQAAIFVDGKTTGKTTKSTFKEDAGQREIELTKAGYKAWTRKINIVADESTFVHAELAPQ